MKDVFLLYHNCCLYEIVILNYFMKYTNCDMQFCSMDGQAIQTVEGYSVNPNLALADLDVKQIRSFIIPGGDITNVKCEEVMGLLLHLKEQHTLVAAICAGVDLLDKAGLLTGIASTHSTDGDVVNDRGCITARANGYVDFAIAVADELQLFESGADLQETIDFWKYHKRM